MPRPLKGPARLCHTSRIDVPWYVDHPDPAHIKRRVRKWFRTEIDARKYQKQINDQIIVEGVASGMFDATLRADALAARQFLDAHGLPACSLLEAVRMVTQLEVTTEKASQPIEPLLAAFLEEKKHLESGSPLTIANLKTRLNLWIDLAKIQNVGSIDRNAVEILRRRMVSPQTRRNDMAAASNFCTWLVDRNLLAFHPLKGLKRPRADIAPKSIFSVQECKRLLQSALNQSALATVAVMLFAGARPSELSQTRLFYDKPRVVKIEGGKLKGRANRAVPMNKTLARWLAKAGNPEKVEPLSRDQREALAEAARITWKPDICRHTYISNRLQIAQNDALVAREAGTSEDIIYRHYHRLVSPKDAKSFWAIK